METIILSNYQTTVGLYLYCTASMAELVKALDSSSNPRMRAWVRIPLDALFLYLFRYCNFHYSLQHVLVAQWIAHQTSDLGVVGSSPI